MNMPEHGRFAVIGDPIAHSMSPEIHHQFARQFGLAIEYDKVRVPAAELAPWVAEFAGAGGRGLNVTVPHKIAVFQLVASTDALAAAAGAVNTVAIEAQTGRLVGFNTDGWGMLQDIQQRHAQTVAGRHVLMIGAGGAAKGVIAPLLAAEPASLTIVNRTADRARALAAAATARAGSIPLRAMSFDELSQPPTGACPQIVVNATSAGLSDTTVALSSRWIDGAFCYDMSYGASAVFCRWAAENGARLSVDGLGMLVEQAARSFEIWHGRMPDTDPVFARLRARVDSPPEQTP